MVLKPVENELLDDQITLSEEGLKLFLVLILIKHFCLNQIKEDIPETEMKFTSLENPENDSQFLNISCSFQVSSQILYELQKGQALITFEKEEGMGNVQKFDRVTFGKHRDFQRAFIDIWLYNFNICHFISSHSNTLGQV